MPTLSALCCFSFPVITRLLSLNAATAAALVLIGLTAAPSISHAAQSYDNCTGFIDSLPATISTQGTWCLRADLTTATLSGNAITVATNNVTIDCNDFKLGGLAAGPSTQTIGIYADARENITIRRCNVRGFLRGTYLFNGVNHLVEDNRFDGNTYNGIFVKADRSVIRRNLVIATGASTISLPAYGIISSGSVDVLDNIINGVTASGSSNDAAGIFTLSNPDGRITGNSVRGLVKASFGIAYGIYNFNSGRITLRNNDVVGDGLAGSFGLYCANARGRARDNGISAFATGIQGCTSVSSGNDIDP